MGRNTTTTVRTMATSRLVASSTCHHSGGATLVPRQLKCGRRAGVKAKTRSSAATAAHWSSGTPIAVQAAQIANCQARPSTAPNPRSWATDRPPARTRHRSVPGSRTAIDQVNR